MRALAEQCTPTADESNYSAAGTSHRYHAVLALCHTIFPQICLLFEGRFGPPSNILFLRPCTRPPNHHHERHLDRISRFPQFYTLAIPTDRRTRTDRQNDDGIRPLYATRYLIITKSRQKTLCKLFRYTVYTAQTDKERDIGVASNGALEHIRLHF